MVGAVQPSEHSVPRDLQQQELRTMETNNNTQAFAVGAAQGFALSWLFGPHTMNALAGLR